ncbi:MAG: hypothetical protein A2Z90_12720 [Burkholderiales bacterium GWA2_64_37]|nr:MAG: hypothetical protein A2Z90_12720 [Burkholderiales bacterium GWA2_64_37]
MIPVTVVGAVDGGVVSQTEPLIVVGFPLLVKVSETMAKLLALPSGGAVAANAPQLYVRDSRETSPRLSSKAGFFRPNLDWRGQHRVWRTLIW